jgi:hypothetical protein
MKSSPSERRGAFSCSVLVSLVSLGDILDFKKRTIFELRYLLQLQGLPYLLSARMLGNFFCTVYPAGKNIAKTLLSLRAAPYVNWHQDRSSVALDIKAGCGHFRLYFAYTDFHGKPECTSPGVHVLSG